MNNRQAILLGDVGLSIEAKKIAKVLDFFGVPSHALTTGELLSAASCAGSSTSGLMCSADAFLSFTEALRRDSRCMEFWQEHIHSVFVYADDNPAGLQQLVQRLTENQGAVVSQMSRSAGDFVVSNQLDDVCGVMAGLRVSTSKAKSDASVVLDTSNRNAIRIISVGDGAIFLKLEYKGVPVFLSTSSEIIDIDAKLTSQNFDVREHFLTAVPLVLYIKWAFADTSWNAPKTSACLMIDDPLLRPTHGFVNFEELLSLMKQHKFSTNIAFIPWNWRRSTPEVVQLFTENPERYSLSVHGCDHTRAEFGSSNQQRLYWKAEQALERMNRHRSLTGIHHDPVMVFPQGIFSEAAMTVLKHTDLIGAVNNDVVSADPCPRAITVSDVWDIAVMRYSFPLFTRRYP